MRSVKKKILLSILIFSILCIPVLNTNAAEDNSIESFVTRFYEYILERNPDPPGLAAWSDNLRMGKEAGANVGYGFIQSDEFKKRNLSDEEYIRVLYRAFFDREADENGLNAWISEMNDGLSRLHVYRGFAESAEFSEICSRYGIKRGYIALTAPADQNEGVTKFVVRCYRLCLGRGADEEGLNAWCIQLLSGANSAKEAAHGFVFSEEFRKKGLSDEEYVIILYRVFMDREADEAGLNAWVQELSRGKSRNHVFNGFADSAEFRKICDKYGIYVGEPSPPEVDAWKTEYVRLIKDYRELHNGAGASFSLYDINKDGLPELFLTYAYSDELLIYAMSGAQARQILSLQSNMAGYQVAFDGYCRFGIYCTKDIGFIYEFYYFDGTLTLEKTVIQERDESGCRVNGVRYNSATFKKYVNMFNGYVKPKEYLLDGFNGGVGEGEITIDNIQSYVQ